MTEGWSVFVPGGPALMGNIIAALRLPAALPAPGPTRECLERLLAALRQATYQAESQGVRVSIFPDRHRPPTGTQ